MPTTVTAGTAWGNVILMRIDVSLVFAKQDREVALEIVQRLERAAAANVWMEEVTSPVNETWDQGLTSAGVILLLSPASVPDRVERRDWEDLLAHTGRPPIARLLVQPCKYPALLERHAFFRWSDPGVLRDLHKWTIGLHGERGRQPAATTYEGSTEELWLRLADRPGVLRVQDLMLARRFAHEAADHFRDVLVVPCAGRSLPMILGEIALSTGVQLRGDADEACRQIRSVLADTRVLLVLEGMSDGAPFVAEGQASVIYAPAGDPEPVPLPAMLADTFVHWPTRGAECARYVPAVETTLETADWQEARRIGQAAFAFLHGHERLFEAAHLAEVLLRRSTDNGDDEVAAWAREELSWITGGDRVRAASAPVEQLAFAFA